MMKKQSLFFVAGLITVLFLFIGYASADNKKVYFNKMHFKTMPFQGRICQEGTTWSGERVQLPDSTWKRERQGYYKISDCNDLIDGYMTMNEKWEGELLPGPNPPDGHIGPKNVIIKGSIVIVPERLCTLFGDVEIINPPIGTLEDCCIEAFGTWEGVFYQTTNQTNLYPEHGPLISIIEARGTGFLEGLTLKVFNIFAGKDGYGCIFNDENKFTGYMKYMKGKTFFNDNDD